MYIQRKLDISSVVAKKSCFLFGPRQCGKSALIDKTMQGAHVFDLLSGDTFRRLSANPEYIEQVCRDDAPIIIDEIQKLPFLLDEVHRLIEKKGKRFLLTGSSARKLRRSGTNLLGGRARIRNIHPFSAAELGDAFDLERALNIGLLPGIWFSDDAEIDTFSRDSEITYWRTRTGLEVDFVVNGEVAIEAKAAHTIVTGVLKGLRAIADEGAFRHRIVVCNEPVERMVDGITIMPWRSFVSRLWAGELV